MPPRPSRPTMRYCPPLIVPATKRVRSSESKPAPDLSGGVEVLPLPAESPSGRGFDVSGRMRVLASEESSTAAPHEGHDRLSSAISDVQEEHLMRGEL